MTFGSLFSGIGGIDLGLERAGMECRWQVEIDPFCRQVLTKHWPKIPKYGDITKLTGNELEPVQLICGGFPCQDLSQAGKRAGIEGSRSGLWFDFARIIGVVRPRYVLIENVPGLLVYDGMRRVVGELARLGYVGIWRSLRASEFGASHLRKRVFIVADTERTERRPHEQHIRLSRGRFQETDRSGSHSGALAHTAEPRSDGTTRQEQRVLGPPLPAARFSDGDEPLEDTGCTGHWRPAESAGVDRRRPSGDDCGAGRTLADAERAGLEIGIREREQPLRQNAESLAPGLPDGELAHTMCGGAGPGPETLAGTEPEASRNSATRSSARDGGKESSTTSVSRSGDLADNGSGLPFAPGPADTRWPTILAARPDLAPALESPICGMVDGLSDRLDGAMRDRTKRLGRLGNAVVPQVAEWIGRRILEMETR